MFLLIPKPSRWSPLPVSHLHSTMFLLIRFSVFHLVYLALKFTFHYVSTYTDFQFRQIPRCTSFTFHYVSTYTEACAYIAMRLREFTFHYVSTYTKVRDARAAAIEYLHSTMFLLIRIFFFYLFEKFDIYIPLCFYLYPESASYNHQECSFTFHYVSTYTRFKIKFKKVTKGFTFHYVSTYTKFTNILVCSSNIYIPLCFYLYVNSQISLFVQAIFTFHYVSTYTHLP